MNIKPQKQEISYFGLKVKNPRLQKIMTGLKNLFESSESELNHSINKITDGLDSLWLVCANVLGALVLAHILILIYMHENNFYAYDFVSGAGMALELMYVQFELIGLVLAMSLIGGIPFCFYIYRRQLKLGVMCMQNNELNASPVDVPKEILFVKFLKFCSLFLLAFNILMTVKWFAGNLSSKNYESVIYTYFFAVCVGVFITTVYFIDIPRPRWQRSVIGFSMLSVMAILFPEGSASIVTIALQRARLGGGILVTLDYSESRLVSKGDLVRRINKIQKSQNQEITNPSPPTPDGLAHEGERSFECVSPAQGKLLLDSPTHLYVQVLADPCDLSDAQASMQTTPLFTQMIEKTKLRQYRIFKSAV